MVPLDEILLSRCLPRLKLLVLPDKETVLTDNANANPVQTLLAPNRCRPTDEIFMPLAPDTVLAVPSDCADRYGHVFT